MYEYLEEECLQDGARLHRTRGIRKKRIHRKSHLTMRWPSTEADCTEELWSLTGDCLNCLNTVKRNVLQDGPVWAGRLDQVTHCGLFQTYPLLWSCSWCKNCMWTQKIKKVKRKTEPSTSVPYFFPQKGSIAIHVCLPKLLRMFYHWLIYIYFFFFFKFWSLGLAQAVAKSIR